jgi:L-seryl-tRNA(Ser) seleniumtransferase
MNKSELYRSIPKVDELLTYRKIKSIKESIPNRVLKDSINEVLDTIRNDIGQLTAKESETFTIEMDAIIDQIIAKAKANNQYNLRKVINATGVIIHTNLGRSCLSEEIKEQLTDIACGYSNLEFNLATGQRGHRYDHVEDLICELTGAEAALVVNNNAAAVMLALDTIAKNKEAIVSRGQLVEIGGSFRVPDVMKFSGVKLKEVGTTNKTHLRDYEDNINENTGVLLKVHTSNYRILGFTDAVDNTALVQLGNQYDIPVLEDLGSGLLIDFSEQLNVYEPTVQDVLKTGVDVVTFSGDKMLGGPQAGIIVGKKKYVEQMKYNQLTRALRIDKMTMTALEATLKLYLAPEQAVQKIPTLRNIFIEKEKLKTKADQLYALLETIDGFHLNIIEAKAQVGGGSLPLKSLETYAITVEHEQLKPDTLAQHMRTSDTPVVPRIKDDKVLLDVRTIESYDFSRVKKCLATIYHEVI